MRRIGQIDKLVRVWRLDGGSETKLSKHAFVQPNETLRTRAGVVSYGNLGWTLETVDGQDIVKKERITLDIAKGHSRERVDVFGASTHLTTFSKAQEDFSRHKAAISAERRRGMTALWGEKEFECIIGGIQHRRTYEEGGFDQGLDAICVASRRQFYEENDDGFVVDNSPKPKEKIEINGNRYMIESVIADIAVLSLQLAYDRTDGI